MVMQFPFIFYDLAEMNLVVDFPRLGDFDVFLDAHCKHFCRRICDDPKMLKTSLEIRINGSHHTIFPASFPLRFNNDTW